MKHDYAIASAARLPIVVKYGGNAMPSPGGACTDPTLFEVAQLWRAGWPIVLVHGGGPEIDAALAERGIVTDRIDGMRVTRKATLDVTEAVLCGTINKRLVRALTALGLPAVGVSGQDGASLVARVARTASGADLGYVGKIERCDARLVQTLLDAKFLPVVAPIAAAADSTTAYNVNADLAAAALAGALRASAFVAITNVRRVLRDVDDPASAIERLTPAQARVFADSAACRSGMKPKLHAAALAAAGGTVRSFICGAEPGSISAAMFAGDATIVASEHL